MPFQVGIEIRGYQALADSLEGAVATAATEAMREVTPAALADLRGQVTSAGLGGRLANTWRDRVYPENRASMTPTGYIWSNAPAIIDAFSRGAAIRPVNGAKYLWIPTKNVPRQRGLVNRRGKSVAGGKMGPEDVENAFNTDFIIRRGRAGTLLAFIDVTRAKSGRGFRRDTAGRRRQGRMAEPVLMFLLRRTVRLPKLLDLDAPGEEWARNFAGAFERRLGV